MAKFKVGDKARVVKTGPITKGLLGSEVMILEIDNTDIPYKTSNMLDGEYIWARDEHIEPILLDYSSLAQQDVKRLKDKLRIPQLA